MRVGVHVSVGGGLVRAALHAGSIGCECVQIFARSARGWRGRIYSEAEVQGFRETVGALGMSPVVIHSCYLVNLASPDGVLRRRSLRSVADDMVRAALVGGRSVVLHCGHHMGGGVARGMRRVAAGLRSLLAEAPHGLQLLLENAAGRGTELGGEWEHFSILLDMLEGDARIGICLDTCHAHAAGYRLDGARWVGRTLRSFDAVLGLDRLRLLHLNDSLGRPGSRVDLHQHIGRGTIGEEGFRALLRRRALRGVCAILETPFQREGDDRRNLARVRRLRGDRRR